jgi:hypothetical protein
VLETLNQTYARETRNLRNEIFSKRMELRELLTNPGIKIEAIQAKTSEIVDLQSKLEEKGIDYLIRVRGLLNADQLRGWCPELELPIAGAAGRSDFMGPMYPRRLAPPEKIQQD